MDRINQKLIFALTENARMSFSELGKRVHLSAPAVAERIRKLEESGVITGYRPTLNLEKMGIPITALIGCEVHHAKEKEFKVLVEQLDEVIESQNLTGPYAFILKVGVSSMSALDDLLNRLIDLSDTHTMMILSTPIKREMPRQLNLFNNGVDV